MLADAGLRRRRVRRRASRTRSTPMSKPASPPAARAAMTASSPSAAARALDVGKVIAFMAGQTRPMWDFEDIGDWWTRADPDGIVPIVAVPTTAGTGSEVGRAGVITDEATHTKKVIFHPQMMPKRRHLRSGTHRRHAALHHRRHRHGRARPLPRSLLRAGLPSDGRRHRRRGHAARLRESAEGGRQRQRHRGARRT